jgi:NTE family protein
MAQTREKPEYDETSRQKIGLALSGGGFRASIFHLGVIRRLEELGIMKDVSVISTVSGGSIIGAYYVCEMEKRLRTRRKEINDGHLDEIRLEIFESIACVFLGAVQRNLRTRALVFAPIFHPILFIKSLWPTVSRSDLIQAEYDQHLYGGSPFHDGLTIGDLPGVPAAAAEADETPDEARRKKCLAGPKMVINATSLLSGERVAYSRQSICGVQELKKVNTNVLTLARVVGASSCVPGLFPPTIIDGKVLVDGGVSDNQGLDGLLEEGRVYDGSDDFSRSDYNLILVSDASGQIEQLNSMSPKATAVLPRTMTVFQHEIRNKIIKQLLLWKEGKEAEWEKDKQEQRTATHATEQPKSREFAFIHLFLDVKERGISERVRSEYIPELGRIRTDLDQFSYIEQESLMYHGYTLINAQLRKYCGEFLKARKLEPGRIQALHERPLFASKGRADTDARRDPGTCPPEDTDKKKRDRIQRELAAGKQAVFLLRAMINYPWRAIPLALLIWLPPIVLYLTFCHVTVRDWVYRLVQSTLAEWWASGPGWMRAVAGWFIGDALGAVGQAAVRIGTILLEGSLIAYVLGLATYCLMRLAVRAWDRQRYIELAGVPYTVEWGSAPGAKA